jgi:hypothetical protein
MGLDMISDWLYRIRLWRVNLLIGEGKIGCVSRTLICCHETAPAVDRHGRTLPDVHHLTMTVITILVF